MTTMRNYPGCIFLFLIALTPVAHAGDYMAGWDAMTMSNHTAGCKDAVLRGQVEKISRNRGITADQIPTEVMTKLDASFSRLCDCITERAATQMDFKDYLVSQQEFMDENMVAVMQDKNCLPSRE